METDLAEILSVLSEEDLIRLMVRLRNSNKKAGLLTVLKELEEREEAREKYLNRLRIESISK